MLRFSTRRNFVASSNNLMKRSTLLGAACTSSSSFITNNKNKNTNTSLSHNTYINSNNLMMITSARFASETGAENPLHKKLEALINKGRIVVFLTGTPIQPRCGFTVRMVEMLEQLPIKYDYVDIMEDEEVCEGLKSYSQWPTYPQLYIDGELVGGWDITRQMVIDGTLIQHLHEKKLLLDQ